MKNSDIGAFFTVPSYEPRSSVAVTSFIESGGSPSAVRSLVLSEPFDQLFITLEKFESLKVPRSQQVDRRVSRQLWDWVWLNSRLLQGNVVIDATCFTREVLGMLLFALSVRRDYLEAVQVNYVPTGLAGYATQRSNIDYGDKWLSKGVCTIRSIVGYPGEFQSGRVRRVLALAGHEEQRLLEAIEYLEPSELSISNESAESSTVKGAEHISKLVEDHLRERIALPNIGPISFTANSIHKTFTSIFDYLKEYRDDNVAVIAMNTKLSFVGAALACLHLRTARMVYAVPEIYNPKYSTDYGELQTFDVTELIKTSTTTRVQQSQHG